MKGISYKISASIAAIAAFAVVSCSKGLPDDLYQKTDKVEDVPFISVTATEDPYAIVPDSEWVEIDMRETVASMGVVSAGSTTFPDQMPAHYVAPRSHFKMMVGNVTVEQYEQFVEANPTVGMPEEPFWGWTDYKGRSRKNFPVVGITWNQADAFARWLGGRLPTEAEWELSAACATADDSAARYLSYSSNGISSKAAWFFNSKVLSYGTDTVTVFTNPSGEEVVRVGIMAHPCGLEKDGKTSPYNALGLTDMCGNVWEWCSDWYSETYYEDCQAGIDTTRAVTAIDGTGKQVVIDTPVVEAPKGPETGTMKTVRGGSWYTPEYAVKINSRGKIAPGIRSEQIGFRVVIDID